MSRGRLPLRLRILWTLRERSRRGVLAWLAIVLCLSLLAATSKIVWDWQRWSIPAETARALTLSSSDTEQIAGVVALLRDGRKTIAALQAVEKGSGAASVQARGALDHLREQLR